MACQDVWPPRVPENRGWVTRRHDGGFSRRDGRADRPTQTAANPTGRLLDLTCVYEPHRSAEALEALLGQAPIPVGEVYLPRDPPRMFKAVRQTSKPCLAFKILAAGRLSERRQWVEKAFQETFESIKPTDALIVGMYDRHSDQPAENAALVRRFGATAQV